MTNPQIPTTVLDLSKGVGYGFLYHPVIGKKRPGFPFFKEPKRSRFAHIYKVKKTLV